MVESFDKGLLSELKPVFYPKSIAIIGASQDVQKYSYLWISSLMNADFTGDIYPVNPRGGELLGLKIYPSLMAIPKMVDYVIVITPRKAASNLLSDCAAKKVKAIHFFTAGFNEADDTTGYELEEELARKARQHGFRIIGPNCIGTYCPEHKLPLGPPGVIGKSGSVGFISQSGGISHKFLDMGIARGINYSKGVSFGNGTDLDSIDFLKYLAIDPKTSVIGAYLEGTRDGRRLFNTMKEITKVKPLIVWKGGRTDVGAATAKSHTGSLASSAAIWSAAFKQANITEVYSMEEMADTLLIFQQLQKWHGKGIAIVGGLANGGGGISVSASDVCAELGLSIPLLSPSTRQQLTNLLGHVGSILRNPVDISQYGGKPSILKKALKLILADQAIDLILIQEDVGVLLEYLPWEQIEAINDIIMDFSAKQGKPIVIVLPPGSTETKRLQAEHKLLQGAIPVFPSMERAAKAIMNISRYSLSKAASEKLRGQQELAPLPHL